MSNKKTTAIPIPLSDNLAHVPTAIPVQNRVKQKVEPARTSKTTQKLVVFAEADLVEPTTDKPLYEGGFEEGRFVSTEGQRESGLRRVTAYLTAESFRLRDMQEQNSRARISGFSEMKRFDEVLYSPFCVSDATVTAEELEAAVASEKSVGEVFVFDYGVTVIWGMEEADEKQILRLLQPYEIDRMSLSDIEVENFYFTHNPDKPPRLFNDVINLRSGHHMLKLTISHALAQSVKLAQFEELIDNTILHTKYIPYELSTTGSIKISRKDINMQIGELFAMRMNVNLVSNVLDAPEIFWSYPSLDPLYKAVRGYLEISQRVEVLNQRCAVVSDMLDMLRDHANIMHGETLEWIVIILIFLEILIGIVEIMMDIYGHTTR